MAIFKKRSTAVLVFVVVVIFASLFAINRSLGEKADEISDLFSDGVYSETAGYKQKSIKSQLDMRANAAQNLVSVGSSYEDAATETSVLRGALDTLKNALGVKKLSPKELFAANTELEKAFDALSAKLDTLTLKSRDKTIKADSESIMENAATVIGRAGYNEAVREFERKVLGRFPTSALKAVAFVREPELFE